MNFSPSDHVSVMKKVFPMTIKGICLTCLGDVFSDQAELDLFSNTYHDCWREMEVGGWGRVGRAFLA